MLAAERGEELGVPDGLRVEQLPLDLAEAAYRFGETVAETQALAFWFWYFWRNRSTRPAVSTSFCLPVKYGWQALQMSVWISAWVERVTNVLPHAHFTVAA